MSLDDVALSDEALELQIERIRSVVMDLERIDSRLKAELLPYWQEHDEMKQLWGQVFEAQGYSLSAEQKAVRAQAYARLDAVGQEYGPTRMAYLENRLKIKAASWELKATQAALAAQRKKKRRAA